jgi:thiosulfate/3-mercaptopyruvate sulfurtransferase
MSTVTLVLTLSALLAPAPGLLLSPADLAAEMKDPALVILHVDMTSAGFDAGHIKGARFVGYNQITIEGSPQVGSELPPAADLVAVFQAAGVTDASRVVIYGPALAATRAFFTLDYLGHRNVGILNGGLAGWKAQGLEVEQGANGANGANGAKGAKGAKGALTAKPRPEVVAMADWISQRLESPQIALVDARPDAEFTGDDGGMNGMHPAGHLPGAKQLVWTDVVSRSGQFVSDAELRAKMTAAGARSGVPVVTYCMVGMRASVIYFVARHLGYDAKLYDGSIVDWGQRKLPVKRGR